MRRRGRLQWGRDQLIAELSPECNLPKVTVKLQWGRDQLIAELLPPKRVHCRKRALQWGRDQLIAELLPTMESETDSERFNGAAIN